MLLNRLLRHLNLLIIVFASTLVACQDESKQPALVVDELPRIYESDIESAKKARHTILNISSSSGVKPADSPLKLTLEELDDLSHITLKSGRKTLINADYYNPNLEGLCIDTAQNSIVFFIDNVDEGIGQPMHDLLHRNSNGQWQFTELVVDEDIDPLKQFTQCNTPEAKPYWEDLASEIGGHVCSCNIPEAVFDEPADDQWRNAIGKVYENALFELDASFNEGAAFPVTLFEVQDPKKLASLIQQAEQDKNYEVTHFTQGDASLLIINQHVAPFHNIGYGFIRSNSQAQWQLWYTAGDSSKAFHPIREATQKDNGSINLELCARDCSWWGERAYINLDLAKQAFQIDPD